MKQYSKLKIAIWILTILWMAVIFYFSNQPAEISKEESGKVLAKMNLISEDEIAVEGDNRISVLQRVIRKTAHVSVYFILGILITLSVINTMFSNLGSYLVSYILGTLYGISDEFHQMFIPGRGPGIRDVLLDSAGVLIGILVVAVSVELIIYRKRKHSLSF